MAQHSIPLQLLRRIAARRRSQVPPQTRTGDRAREGPVERRVIHPQDQHRHAGALYAEQKVIGRHALARRHQGPGRVQHRHSFVPHSGTQCLCRALISCPLHGLQGRMQLIFVRTDQRHRQPQHQQRRCIRHTRQTMAPRLVRPVHQRRAQRHERNAPPCNASEGSGHGGGRRGIESRLRARRLVPRRTKDARSQVRIRMRCHVTHAYRREDRVVRMRGVRQKRIMLRRALGRGITPNHGPDIYKVEPEHAHAL